MFSGKKQKIFERRKRIRKQGVSSMEMAYRIHKLVDSDLTKTIEYHMDKHFKERENKEYD